MRASLADAGIASILLKGGAFRALLYDGLADRVSVDCDLLIAPQEFSTGTDVLAGLGFSPFHLEPEAFGTHNLHARTWVRRSDRMIVDLHVNLPQASCSSEHAWALLWPRTITRDIGGAPTRILDEAGTAVLAALHAANHGPGWPRGIEDLRRALRRFDVDVWEDAHGLAKALDAESPFAEGLQLVPEGEPLRLRLGLTDGNSVKRLLAWEDAPWGARALEEIRSAPGVGARLRLIARLLIPTPRAMRLDTSLARRGPRGLAAAYALRPLHLAARLPAALQAWRRARRLAR